MSMSRRSPRRRAYRVEALESRNLLTLIGAKPTIDVVSGPGVRRYASGAIAITQPAVLQVFGTAQPGAPGTTVSVSIFAVNSEGNFVNEGTPLATVTPNSLGMYSANVSLPSLIRKDVNFLVARETATAVQTSSLALSGTQLTGLTGAIALNPGTLSNLNATVANSGSSLTGLGGTISTPINTITGLGGTISNPSTTITGLGGNVTTAATPISNIGGTITTDLYNITTPSGPGTAGPSTGTLSGGTGTLNPQIGTISGGTGTVTSSTSTLSGGTALLGASTSTLSAGTGTIGTSTGTLTQQGTAAESARTGTLSDGTGTISGATGTVTQLETEVATSDPLTVFIHQRKNLLGNFLQAKAKIKPAIHPAQARALAIRPHRSR